MGFNTARFFAKYIVHIEPEEVSTFFNNLNNILIELERDKIEKPILFVHASVVQSLDKNLNAIK